jgi:hypothetical protein
MAVWKDDRPVSAFMQENRQRRRDEKDGVSFFQALIEAGYEPETKTEPMQGSQPMRVGPGLVGPPIRSSADI